MYYNTTNQTGQKLREAEAKAESQKEIIAEVFQWAKKLGPSEAERFFPINTPLTSIRRAFTDLKKEGAIQKTENKTVGKYGRPEHIYEMVTEP